MRKIYLIVICTVVSQLAFSQMKADTLRLYFAINEVSSETNNRKMDSLLAALNGKIIKLKIIGYADFLNNNNYNQVLSQNRADAAKDYFMKKANPNQVNLGECRAFGEKFSKDNGSHKGEAKQRRVDLIWEPLILVESYNEEPKKQPKPVKKDTVLQKKNLEDLKKGESLSIEGLNFIPGRHIVVKDAVPVLEKLLKTMLENPKLKIEIQGHICCVTDQEDGMDIDTHERKLSYNRAKAVYAYLIKHGVDASRLTYKGFGRTRPKFNPERTPEEEQANRRVEILVLDR